ncbi:MAG: o-succinylbenzoate synthase [Halochromatium sp.]
MLLQLKRIPYRLPLRRPWRTAHGVRRERAGWLVQASGDGCCGYGDCAPLPEAGTETPLAAAERLSTWLREHGQCTLQTQLALLEHAVPSATPAADAALETALLDLSARLGRLPLRESLLGDGSRAGSSKATSEIEINAALGAVAASSQPAVPDQVSDDAWDQVSAEIPEAAPQGAEQALHPALAAGFRVLKVKVGVAPVEQELAAIRHLCARLPPGARLRLDANRAWSLPTARKLLDDLLPLANWIESLEEPCAAATDAELRVLQARTPIALAVDESLPARGWPLDPEQLPLRRLVLKPGIVGGLRPTLALARRARSAGLEVVITSLIESAAGLWSSAQLAAATGSPLAHGLATGIWLAADLGAAPAIARGYIQLPKRPGSGFSPAQRAADEPVSF